MPQADLKELGTIYGLVAASDIALPELAPAKADSEPDIKFAEGQVDWGAPDNPPAFDDFLRGRPGEIWMNIPRKLKMRVEAGRSITYQPYPEATPPELRAFLLGSGLGALLAQRGNLVLHANAIAMPDGAAVICLGASGAGKSTTAAAMMLRGHRMLADDVCPIAPDGSIHSGLARMKLWEDAAEGLGIATQGLERIPGDRAKWEVPIASDGEHRPSKPGLFVLLDPVPSDGIITAELTGLGKFLALRNNIYRPLFNQALGIEAECMKRVAEISQTTPMVKVSRPEEGFEVATLIDTIVHLYETRRLPQMDGTGNAAREWGENRNDNCADCQ